MDKLKMHTPDLAAVKYAQLVELFPNAVTETADENGVIIRAIDPDVLQQEITDSVERRFVKALDTADEVIVYAKLPKGPRGFYIPTPVGNYSPDWAITFKKDAVKHVFFIAETKGTMDDLQIRPIEKRKVDCAKKLFNEFSADDVKYHDVDSYSNMLTVIESL